MPDLEEPAAEILVTEAEDANKLVSNPMARC